MFSQLPPIPRSEPARSREATKYENGIWMKTSNGIFKFHAEQTLNKPLLILMGFLLLLILLFKIKALPLNIIKI